MGQFYIVGDKPYDFRFADDVYTSEDNCGAAAVTGKSVTVGQSVALHCDASSGNLKFMPSETGTYRFLIQPGIAPDLIIKKL